MFCEQHHFKPAIASTSGAPKATADAEGTLTPPPTATVFVYRFNTTTHKEALNIFNTPKSVKK
jgi:hypothetical protein